MITTILLVYYALGVAACGLAFILVPENIKVGEAISTVLGFPIWLTVLALAAVWNPRRQYLWRKKW